MRLSNWFASHITGQQGGTVEKERCWWMRRQSILKRSDGGGGMEGNGKKGRKSKSDK